jgi:hypothetical protein
VTAWHECVGVICAQVESKALAYIRVRVRFVEYVYSMVTESYVTCPGGPLLLPIN